MMAGCIKYVRWTSGVLLSILWITFPCVCDRQTYGERREFQSDRFPTTPPSNLRLDEPMQNETLYTGGKAQILKCEITGDPLPTYTWYKDNVQISDRDPRFHAKFTVWGSRLRISRLRMSDAGIYKCEGSNQYGTKVTSAYISVMEGDGNRPPKKNPDDRPSYDYEEDDDDRIDYHPDYDPNDPNFGGFPGGTGGGAIPGFPGGNPYAGGADRGSMQPDVPVVGPGNRGRDGYCQEYRSYSCSLFLTGKRVYVTSEEQQGTVDKALTSLISDIGGLLSPRCQSHAIEVLCYYSFPVCDERSQVPAPREICKDECLVLQNDLCREEFQQAARNPYLRNNWLLPQCHLLPEPGSLDAVNCVRLGIVTHPTANDCYNGTGEFYRGTQNRASGGQLCMQWSLYARTMNQLYSREPSLGDHNYCRNPRGEEKQPWCFTTAPGNPKQLCDVAKCDIPATQKSTGSSTNLLMIVIPCIAIPVALAVLALLVCLCKKNKTNDKAKTKSTTNAHPGTEMNSLIVPKGSGENSVVASSVSSKHRQFSNNMLQFFNDLGNGKWGKVYAGEVGGFYGDNSPAKATLVVLPQFAEGIKSELDYAADLKHPNLLCLLGLAVQGQPFCAVYEDMGLGELKDYLVVRSTGYAIDYSPGRDSGFGMSSNGYSCPSNPLSYTELLHIVTQVAAAMEYLASHRRVVGDLAARNCVVYDNLNVKICSDLGLGLGRYPDEYTQLPSGLYVSVRWAAPEILQEGRFSSEADMWSFGVVVWEVFSHGVQPYFGCTDYDVMDKLRSRQLLPCPTDCPTHIYTLMVECWNEHPNRRPNFTEVHKRLIQWKCEAVTGGPQPGNQVVNYGPLQTGPHSHTSSSHHSSAHHTGSTNLSNNFGRGQKAPLLHHPAVSGSNGIPPQVALPPPPMQPIPPPFPAMYKKPSPPGSTTSHRSSSLHSSVSPTSSVHNHRHMNGMQPRIQSPRDMAPMPNQHIRNPIPEHTVKKPVNNSDDSGMYIPDTKSTEI